MLACSITDVLPYVLQTKTQFTNFEGINPVSKSSGSQSDKSAGPIQAIESLHDGHPACGEKSSSPATIVRMYSAALQSGSGFLTFTRHHALRNY
jgi:hypothetical protein